MTNQVENQKQNRNKVNLLYINGTGDESKNWLVRKKYKANFFQYRIINTKCKNSWEVLVWRLTPSDSKKNLKVSNLHIFSGGCHLNTLGTKYFSKSQNELNFYVNQNFC